MKPWREAWRTARFIASEWLLELALWVMPSDSAEKILLARFIANYFSLYCQEAK